MYLLLLCGSATAVNAQHAPVLVHVRVGAMGSTALVRDEVATVGVEQTIGRPVSTVTVVPAPGGTAGVGVRLPLRGRASLDAGLDWTATMVRVVEEDGERALQRMGVAQLGGVATLTVGRGAELSGGVAVVRYFTGERGVFAGGSSPAPAVEVRLGWTPPVAGGRLSVIGSAQGHRFTTPMLGQLGAGSGAVTRVGVLARLRVAEVRR